MKREPFVQVSPTVRVEMGPKRQKAVAGVELAPDLDEKGKPRDMEDQPRKRLANGKTLARHYKLGMRDARGKVIQEGEEFTFLDYFGEHVYYIYQLEDVEIDAATLERIAQSKGIAVGEITAAVLVDWYQVDPSFITGPNPWKLKRYMPRGERADRDAALIEAARLEA